MKYRNNKSRARGGH